VTFDELGLHPDLTKAIRDLGYIRPTPIQSQAIQPAMNGSDIMGSAQTGTGKTAAFALPLLHRLLTQPRAGQGARALILTPTRELAQQVTDDFKALGKHTKIRAAPIYGGVGMGPQLHALRTGVEIIVATPGRLLDHMGRGAAAFRQVEALVVDEADRMLDMGFLPDIKRILAQLPGQRQTMLFSATFPMDIQKLAHSILRQPVKAQVDAKPMAAVGITHAVYPVSQHLKTALLLRILNDLGGAKTSILIFVKMKHKADRLKQILEREGYRAGVIHGDRSQGQRQAALQAFREGRYPILVATDIAARGLDVDGISHVINFNVPTTPEDYIHRAGRTARAEAVGDAFTLMDPEEKHIITAVERILGKPIPRVTLPNFPYHTQQDAHRPHERPAGRPTSPHGRPGHQKSSHPPRRFR